MDKLLAKDVSKGRIQDIEAKEARDRITVLDYDTRGINGFRDTDMVIEVISTIVLWYMSSILLIIFIGCLGERTAKALVIQINFRSRKPKLHYGVEHVINQYHKDCRCDHPGRCACEL